METGVTLPQTVPPAADAVDGESDPSQTEIMDHDYFSPPPPPEAGAGETDKDSGTAISPTGDSEGAGKTEVSAETNQDNVEPSADTSAEVSNESGAEVRPEVGKDDDDVILTLSPARYDDEDEDDDDDDENMDVEEGGEVRNKDEDELLADDPDNPTVDEDEEALDDKILESKEAEEKLSKNGGNKDNVQEVSGEICKEAQQNNKQDTKKTKDKTGRKTVKSSSGVGIQTEFDSEEEVDVEVGSVTAEGSKSSSLKDDNDNDKDTVSTATAEEAEMNSGEEEEEADADGSFLSAEHIRKIADHANSESESGSEINDGTPKTKKRGRKSKDFGASFVTEDEDMGLMIDPEWKEKKGKSSRGRRAANVKLDEALLRVPFEYGWSREIVVRNPTGGRSKGMDTYYHPPTGPKLRSMVQIADYLAKHDSPLSTDNFTFVRRCVFEPPHEILRQANSAGRPFFQKKTPGSSSKPRGRGRGWSPGHRSPGVSTPSPVSPKASKPSVKRGRGRPPKLSYPPPEVIIERDEDDADPNLNLSPPVTFGVVASAKRKHSEAESDEEAEIEDSSTSEPPRKKATARKSTTPRIVIVKTGSKAATPSQPTPPPQPTQPLGQLCTLQCPGLEGNPPTLQCAGCMCLFHPKCVNYKGTSMTGFLCLICAQDPSKQASAQAASVVSIAPTLISSPVSSPVPTSLVTVTRSLLTPATTTILVRSALPPGAAAVTGSTVTTVNPNSTTIGALRSILDKRQVPNLPNFSSLNIMTSVPASSQVTPMTSLLTTTGMRTVNVSTSGIHTPHPVVPLSTVTTVRPPPVLTAQPAVPTTLVRAAPPLTLLRPPPPPPLTKAAQPAPIPAIPPPRLTVAPGVLVPVSQGGSMIQPRTDAQITTTANAKQPEIPLNAQLLTLPEAVTKRLKLSQPLALKINNIQIVVPPSCVINSSEGLKVLLPPNTFPLPTDPNAKLSVTVSNNTAGLEGGDAKGVSTTTTVPSGDGESRVGARKDTPVISSPSTRASKRRQAIDAALCYIKKLYGGYDCMLQIFEYLRTQDLLRASTVCRTWKKIATQPCLWKRVRLRSTVISDWEAAAQFFRKVRVESLCLQGMYHKHDRNRTWHLMIANLHQLVGLREIEFGHVPASVLHQVCEKLVNLEVFKAEYIAEVNGDQSRNIPCKVDLGKFVCLNHLRELRLRGTGGLTLPAFSFNGGLAELAALKNLETLSLTTLKSIPDNEFHFLRDMKQLKFLEVGNCNTWSSETYFVLGSLKNLVHLRLEYGGEIPDIGLGDALSNLVSLEELQLIHFSLADTLYITLEQLKKLKTLVVWPEATDMAAVNTNTLTLVSKLQKLQVLEWGVIVTSDSCAPESDNDRQAMWIPFFPPNYVELTKQPNQSIPINRLSLIQLTESLADCLPNTDIKVKKIKSQVKVNGWTNDS